jgi:hypothetical protein
MYKILLVISDIQPEPSKPLIETIGKTVEEGLATQQSRLKRRLFVSAQF